MSKQTQAWLCIKLASFHQKLFPHHPLVWLGASFAGLSGLRELLGWRGQTTSCMYLAVDTECGRWVPYFWIMWFPIFQQSDSGPREAFSDTGHRATGSGTWVTLIFPPYFTSQSKS